MNEERLLFPLASGQQPDPRVGRLLEDHVDLRDATNALAGLARCPRTRAIRRWSSARLDDL